LLSPSISPKKTWSGAIGGLVGGVVAGVAVAYASGIAKLGIVGVMALLLSVLAQAGDLFESAVKRRFGVKDAGGLIPGHGGLMDRLDGFVLAAFAAVLIGILHAGTSSPGRGLLVW
jgi:phosphatidate cytidylyltransferase